MKLNMEVVWVSGFGGFLPVGKGVQGVFVAFSERL